MYLIADASKGSSKVKGMIGWAVVQKGKNPGEWLPIVFGSRTLTEAEMNYPINQLEQLAIVCWYRDCYYLLYGRPTTIFCDNKPSVHRAAKEEKRFMIPLGSLINDTRSKVEFRPGNENTVPDFLSRYHAPEINAVQGPVTGKEIYLEKIKDHQNNDNEICRIKDQINEKVNSKDIETENFQDIIHNMHILNGILFVRQDGHDKAVIPYNDREKYVINTHLDPMLGHVGKEKLADRISLRAYVVGLGSIIKNITETCGRCIQTSEKHHKTENEPIHPMPIPNNMFNRWHIDLTGPFKENNSKFYVIGAIDALTKYMVGGIIPDKTALSVSNYILHEIIIKFGVPNVITTDRGNEFHNELSKQLGEVYEITRIRTAPYHPAANGEIEIRWRFIKKFIRRNYEPNFKIKEILPRAIFAINGVINSTTGYAPHYLVFGRMPDTPTNYKLPNKNNLKKRRMYNMRHYNAIENERHRLDLLDKARTRIIQKQLVRNEAHNSKYASYRDIAPLDLVLVRVHKAKVPNKSLVPQFTVNSSGRPFVVHRVKGPSVVILDDSRNLMWTEHMNNLRLFNNGKYNKDSLVKYKFPTRDNQGLDAIYVP